MQIFAEIFDLKYLRMEWSQLRMDTSTLIFAPNNPRDHIFMFENLPDFENLRGGGTAHDHTHTHTHTHSVTILNFHCSANNFLTAGAKILIFLPGLGWPLTLISQTEFCLNIN